MFGIFSHFKESFSLQLYDTLRFACEINWKSKFTVGIQRNLCTITESYSNVFPLGVMIFLKATSNISVAKKTL